MQGQRDRNHGIVPLAVERGAAGKTIAFAGVGGAGGSLAEPLVRQCALGRVKVTDVDDFDWTNLNRQMGSLTATVGLPKVKVVAEHLRGLDDELEVEEYPDGITLGPHGNIDEFLADVDLLVNAVDFKRPDIHLALTRRARELGIPVVMGIEISYGARAMWFSPTSQTFEQFFGLKEGDAQLDLNRMILRLPAYSDLNALQAVREGRIEAPAIATGGQGLGFLLVPVVEAILSGVGVPRPAPVVRYADSRELVIGEIRHPRLTWWTSLARVVIRDKVLHRNPAAI